MTTDGHKAYLEAVEGSFGADIDYAQLIKVYGNAPETLKGRYSPADCTGIVKRTVEGQPDEKYISTSFVERQNLTMRMQMRRFTRLTNAFSKKFENHTHMVALYTVWYNFIRIHKTLRVTPAMEAGLSETVWDMDALVRIMDERAPKQACSWTMLPAKHMEGACGRASGASISRLAMHYRVCGFRRRGIGVGRCLTRPPASP